ncbi:MAG: YdiU family protein [Verrucomicrobiota bacterium]
MAFAFDNSYSQLPEAFYQRLNPWPVKKAKWIAFNRDLAEELGLDADALDSQEGLNYFAGNAVPENAAPLAMAYAGHQFGNFVPQLGDGRALLLGEVVDAEKRRFDIQLKGSGPTPFSRRGDGRSALGPVIREFLVSEGMAALGVPTTRALAAVWTGERVTREEMEPGGILTRVASSHLRIGTTEYFAARGDWDNLKLLVDHVLKRHYPDRAEAANPALALLEAVMERQAHLIAQWMGLGFIHGVMNTDNMTLSGETIDFGPCAFMDNFQADKKFSYIDQNGRYAYSNQPSIAMWNLYRLADATMTLSIEAEGGDQQKTFDKAEAILKKFPETYERAYEKVFAAKLGFAQDSETSSQLAIELLEFFEAQHVDFTLGFRSLIDATTNDQPLLAGSGDWQERWRAAIPADAAERMRQANPAIIPRNHKVEEAIQAANREDFEPFHRMWKALQQPFEPNDEFAEYTRAPEKSEVVRCTFCGT